MFGKKIKERLKKIKDQQEGQPDPEQVRKMAREYSRNKEILKRINKEK